MKLCIQIVLLVLVVFESWTRTVSLRCSTCWAFGEALSLHRGCQILLTSPFAVSGLAHSQGATL